MKPILIFEHINTSGPGLFEYFLKKNALPYHVLRPNEGEEVPDASAISMYSGLCFLGGIESVTAPTLAMIKEIELIKAAKENNTPVIGHCLGGQLISKALGGEVKKHTLNEFGWSQLFSEISHPGRDWLDGASGELCAMQWHSDTFTIPQCASRILSGKYCENQAFVYNNMLAMQFHIEIDAETIKRWALDLVEKHPPPGAGVQSGSEIMKSIDVNYALSSKLAERLYSRWARQLTHN